MTRRNLPIDRIARLLPELAEVSPLRQAILSASVPDSSREWASSSTYATFDKRVLPAEDLDEVVEAALTTVHERVDRLYASLSEALHSASEGDDGAVARRFIDIGEAAEAADQTAEAITYYEAAVRISEPLTDRVPLMLALRRLARARFYRGDLEDAFADYRHSGELAEALGDVEGHLVALTGMGNARAFQGRWSESQEHFEAALLHASAVRIELSAYLYLNLSTVTREQGLLDEAQDWLDRLEPMWDEIESEDHRCLWWNNLGLLYLTRDELAQAETAFHRALAQASTSFSRASVLDNLAETAARQGKFPLAQAYAREAEECGLASGSRRILAEIYTRLGKVFRLQNDPNGVTFFEKALEICRDRHYPLLEAQAHLEYGLFRRQLGEHEEAQAYLERAKEIFDELGATEEYERASFELSATVADDPRAIASD